MKERKGKERKQEDKTFIPRYENIMEKFSKLREEQNHRHHDNTDESDYQKGHVEFISQMLTPLHLYLLFLLRF